MATMYSYTFNMRAAELHKADWFGKADPYLVIYMPKQIKGQRHMVSRQGNAQYALDTMSTVKSVVTDPLAIVTLGLSKLVTTSCDFAMSLHKEIEGYDEVYSSKKIRNTLEPKWDEFTLTIAESYHLNPCAHLLIQVWDWDRFKSSDFMCQCTVNLHALVDGDATTEIQLTNKKGDPAGKLFIRVRHSDTHYHPHSQADRILSQSADPRLESTSAPALHRTQAVSHGLSQSALLEPTQTPMQPVARAYTESDIKVPHTHHIHFPHIHSHHQQQQQQQVQLQLSQQLQQRRVAQQLQQ